MQGPVLVTASGPDPKLQKSSRVIGSHTSDGKTTLSCSGILLAETTHGIIITSILPLHPFLLPAYRITPAAAPSSAAAAFIPFTTLTCTIPGGATPLAAHFQGIVEVDGVRPALHSLLTSSSTAVNAWSVGWTLPGPPLPLETQLTLGCHVAVLRVPELARQLSGSLNLSAARALTGIDRGEAITAHGCPFGALTALKFHGFTSAGVVSAIICPQEPRESINASSSPSPSLLLSDLKCLPGMEGGPVTAISGGADHLIGVLGPSLRAASASVDVATVLPLPAVMAAVSRASASRTIFATIPSVAHTPSTRMRAVQTALEAVVAVELNDGSWASGVVVGPRLVLTNAHALPPALRGAAWDERPAQGLQQHPTFRQSVQKNHALSFKKKDTGVRVCTPGGGAMRESRVYSARVVHAFAPPLDLAVLELDLSTSEEESVALLPRPIALATEDPEVGVSVLVAGYPLWRPQSGASFSNFFFLGPVVTGGTAALLAGKSQPAVLLTTAAVHAGASGGAVLHPNTGRLLGLITSNTRLGLPNRPPPLSSSGAPFPSPSSLLFPHLNYCIAAPALRPVVAALRGSSSGSGGFDSATPEACVAAERALEGAGVLDAWRSMRSMDETRDKQAVDPGTSRSRFAAMVQRQSQGSGKTASSKL